MERKVHKLHTLTQISYDKNSFLSLPTFRLVKNYTSAMRMKTEILMRLPRLIRLRFA